MKKTVFFLSFILIFCLGATALAADTQQVLVSCRNEQTALEGAVFTAYPIGTLEGTEIVPEGDFAAYSVDYDISSAQARLSLALTLEAYILRDGLTSELEGTTDLNGITDFSSTELRQGAYIIIGESLLFEGEHYFFQPCIVVLPMDCDSDKLTVIPKYEKVPESESISVAYRVLKAWQEDEKAQRPEEIEVELLKDGQIYDTVLLNEANNWKHQWEGLSAAHHWTVTEKGVADGYRVALSKTDKVFLLTNTGEGEEPDEKPESTTKPDTDETEDKLPHTGLVQWPIPYLAMAGLFLVLVGYIKLRRSEG